ncbi:MAG: hypothetical protein JNL05_01670 [Flavobacteriales bacterium]|nr:hypothetical protein [Flavobacteriales bacterium]
MPYRLRSRVTTLALACLSAVLAVAQSVVQPGTTLTIASGTTLTLPDGAELATSAGSTVVNDGVLLLAPQATLDEAPGAPFTGLGRERITRTYASGLNNTEPGGLRLVVNTSQAPGTVVLERGHVPVLEPGGASSIARWYDWSSTVNSGLDASVAFGYDPVQLNGITEIDQVLHVLQANSFWQAIPSGVDVGNKQVTAVGLDSLGTLTTFSGALTTAIADGHPTDTPYLFPTISASEVQVSMPAGMRAERWALVDGTGRLIAARILQRGERWYTLDASALAAGTYILLLNERPAGRFIRP